MVVTDSEVLISGRCTIAAVLVRVHVRGAWGGGRSLWHSR